MMKFNLNSNNAIKASNTLACWLSLPRALFDSSECRVEKLIGAISCYFQMCKSGQPKLIFSLSGMEIEIRNARSAL